MLDTIVVVIVVLSALAYGFWQYFRPAARDKKSKNTLFLGQPRGLSDVFSAQQKCDS